MFTRGRQVQGAQCEPADFKTARKGSRPTPSSKNCERRWQSAEHSLGFHEDAVYSADRATAPQASSLLSAVPPPVIQRKLVVGAVDDPREHEANRAADLVMRASTTKTLQFKRAGAADIAAGEAPAIVHDVLRAPGRPLDAATRAFFEPRFGFDFGRVRVHANEQAADSARAIGAKAYTAGQAIVFGRGAFAPGAGTGQHLFAHELAHVVQQHRRRRTARRATRLFSGSQTPVRPRRRHQPARDT